jgi:hypothetical protein
MALPGQWNSSGIWPSARSVRDRSFNFTLSIFHPGLRHRRDNGVGVQITVGWEPVSADEAIERCFLHEIPVLWAGIAIVATGLGHHTGEFLCVRESGRVPLKLFDLIEQGQDRCRSKRWSMSAGLQTMSTRSWRTIVACSTPPPGLPPAVWHLTLILVHHSHGPGVARSAILRSLFVSMFMLRVLVNDDGD